MPLAPAHPTARRGSPPQSRLSRPAITVRFRFVDSYHSPYPSCLPKSVLNVLNNYSNSFFRIWGRCPEGGGGCKDYLRILPGKFLADCFPEISPISPPLFRIASANISSTCSFSRIDTTAVSCARCNR